MQKDCIHRDGRCMICGIQDDTLIGHHIRTWGSSGIDELYNMITLCATCHEEAERGHIPKEALRQILKDNYGL